MKFLGLPYTYPLRIESIEPAEVMETLNLKRRIIQRAGQYWRLRIQLQPEFGNKAQTFGKLLAHKSRHYMGQPFDLPMPQPPGSSPLDTADPASIGSGASAEHLRVVLPVHPSMVGRFVKVADAAKIYQIAAASRAGSTASDLTLYPALPFADLPADSFLVFHSFDIRVRYAPGGDFSVGMNRDGMMSETITVDEALP